MAEVLALTPLFERFPSREKKFAETVVIVHHHGGHKHSFKRQVDWLNEIGFNVVTFDLPHKAFSDISRGLPFNKEWRFGLRHIWADKIESVLGSLPENKIVMSFSMPSMAALRAIARRHAIDIKGWICEGGPALRIVKAYENLFQHHLSKELPALLNRPIFHEALGRISSVALGFHNFEEDTRKNFAALPKGFSVLSLRGGKDVLVPAPLIDEFLFLGLPNIDLERSFFPAADHLGCFRDEPDLYRQVVGGFLRRTATAAKE